MSYENEVKEILMKESENINKQIKSIIENYKDLATKSELDEFKNSILNAIEGIKNFKHSPYSIIKISTIDGGSPKDLKSIIEDVLQTEFHKDFIIYKERLWVKLKNDRIEFWLSKDKLDDSLMTEVKDLLLNELIKNFNARKICLYTKLADGYENWEFFSCENYTEPKKSWLIKFAELMGS